MRPTTVRNLKSLALAVPEIFQGVKILKCVTENELGLAFPLGTFPKNFVHVLFSYRGNKQTNKQTDRQTYTGDYIIPRESFRGDNKLLTI